MTGESSRSSDRRSDHVPLTHAPLARVLCQLRWPTHTKFEPKRVARDLAELIGDNYPYSEERQEALVTIGQAGVVQQQPGGTLYRFLSADRTWTVTLGDVFLALETSAYDGHRDFIARLGEVVDALGQVSKILGLQRIGYRYTNRLEDPDDMTNLGELFSPGILGGLAQADISSVVQTVTETVLKAEGSFLIVRSALLEPNATIEPSLEPVSRRSWIVDLDAYVEVASGMPLELVRSEAERLSARASNHLFESLVKPAFVERFR